MKLDMFTHLSLVSFFPARNGVLTDIPFTHKMSGFSNPKEGQGSAVKILEHKLDQMLASLWEKTDLSLGLEEIMFVNPTEKRMTPNYQLIYAARICNHAERILFV
ncbi:hypothetical protein TNCV_2438041 [Trichonephila clavipes]|nr:hypothetical protein TNCV_2438041 [Trichonephila clavipes]